MELLRMYDDNPEGNGLKGLCLLAVHKSGEAIEQMMFYLKRMIRVHKRVLRREKEKRHAYSEDLSQASITRTTLPLSWASNLRTNLSQAFVRRVSRSG